MSFQSSAGFLASKEPSKIMYLGDGFMPVRYTVGYGMPPPGIERIELVRAVNNNSDLLQSMYYSWLGKQMLEELANE